MDGGALTRYFPPKMDGDGLRNTLLEFGRPAVAEGLQALAKRVRTTTQGTAPAARPRARTRQPAAGAVAPVAMAPVAATPVAPMAMAPMVAASVAAPVAMASPAPRVATGRRRVQAAPVGVPLATAPVAASVPMQVPVAAEPVAATPVPMVAMPAAPLRRKRLTSMAGGALSGKHKRKRMRKDIFNMIP